MTEVKWEYSTKMLCPMSIVCSTAPSAIDLCASGSILTVVESSDAVAEMYTNSYTWKFSSTDFVANVPDTYTVTLDVSLDCNPSETDISTLTFNLLHPCDRQAQINSLSDKILYVNNPSAETDSVDIINASAACSISKVFELLD